MILRLLQKLPSKKMLTYFRKSIMKILRKSLVQAHFDYGCLVWAPAVAKCDLEPQEGPLRAFTRNIKGCYNLNYLERLKLAQISSIQRRTERFRLNYIWKSMRNIVPSLGFEKWEHPNNGPMIRIPKVTG